MAEGDGAVSEPTDIAEMTSRQLLPVSAAAKLLGVSASSLRAWAAAGQVPHVRTPGGHRRFDVAELTRWLAARGGEPPAPAQRPHELVPTRIEAAPVAASVLRGAASEVMAAFDQELGRSRPGGLRPSSARTARMLSAVEILADGLAAGDLGDCYRDAEWEGFRQGAAGQSGDGAVTEALALRRAIDRVISEALEATPQVLRIVERTLDRMAVRVAAGYADGVRCRLRATQD